MELGLFLILLVNIGLISATDWITPAFTKPEGFPCDKIHVYDETCTNWEFNATSKLQTVYIKFEEEQEDPIIIAFIHCSDCDINGPEIGIFSKDSGSRNTLGPEIKKIDNGNYSLTINNRLDHEIMDQRLFKFTVVIEGVQKEFNIKIDLIDIDDEAPRITVNQTRCEIPENYEGETNCTYFITDPDFTNGLKGVTFKMDPQYEKHFDIQLTLRDTNNGDAVLLVRENNTLDFETMPMYFFELIAEDAGGNPGTALIMIKVIDVNDQPPTWVEIFAMKSFDEHEAQSFIVYAKDGDLEINDTIIYGWVDNKCHDNIKIVPDGVKATIEIKGIDRDTPEIENNDNTIKCTLIATELSSDLYNETAEVSFLIQDLNDNKPIITLDTSASSAIILREEEFTTLDKIFAINDIDQGNNAQFDVLLENPAGDILSIDYTEPFQIIPNNGYRNWNFSISVLKPELLDYDATDEWRNFSLKIHSKDKGVPEQQDNDAIIKIELLNLNDEIPIFDVTTNYTVEIRENATIDAYILNVIARDADYKDCVEYDLPMGGNEYKLVRQENTSATLYTARDNVFDYEKVKIVYIQITATDTLTVSGEPDNFHTVTQQIKVSLIDVNDEKPRINLPAEQTKIEEHAEIGYLVTNKITAEDVDTTALLNFTINWENTRVSKLGVQTTNTSWFEDVFTIETYFPNENKTGYAQGILRVNNDVTLDYEVFDTIFLNIQVTDEKQEINNGTDEGTLTITIIDINDHAPDFDMDTISSEKTVTENSKIGLKIANIIATDMDGPDNNDVTYYLEPRNGTANGLVNINLKNGELTVAGNIDADGSGEYTFYLYYNVTATDGTWNTTEPIEIFVEDENDNEPTLNTPLKNGIKIPERESTDKSEFVQQIDGIDWDRDDPHNKIKYELDNEITQLGKMFSIDPETGKVNAYGKIEWDNDTEMAINFFMEDNIGGSGKHNVQKFKFTVIITDIDNNPPVLPKPTEITIEAKEDTALDYKIVDIIATDKDKPCTSATQIKYTILELKDSEDKAISEELFVLKEKEGSKPECKQIAELRVKSSLKDYYGKLFIKIHAKNKDTPNNEDVQIYEINVDPVNYKPPKILSPDDSILILQMEQTAGKKLKAIDGIPIKDFEATDDQGGKFEMQFEPEPDKPWDTDFELINKPDNEKNYARLTLTTNKPAKKEYTLNIKAQHDGRGNSQNFITKKITVKFVDENQLPGFEKLEAQVEFWENKTDIVCATFPAAKDPKCGTEENDNCGYKTYYHIMNTEEKVNFRTNNSNNDLPQLCLERCLDREEQAYHYLNIVATNNAGPPPSVPDGYKPLNLTVKVLDINDNPPSFVKKLFKGGLLDSYEIETVIVTLEATDPDEVDQGKLRYEILKDTISTSDPSLSSIKDKAFEIKGNDIINMVQPTQAMQGHFLFNVQVLDTLDYFDIAEVKIHVISDANRVLFKFNEDIDSVRSKKLQIEDIFSKEFGYSCTIDEFVKKLNETETRATITEVKTHFINNDDEPVDKELITVKLDDLEIVGRLRLRFQDTGLTLIQVEGSSNDKDDDLENLNMLLKILLVVISVVLGTLCMILIVAFILRSRSLNKRLEAMTTNVFGSTKSDLNRVGISAPGTNRHAIEANPVWNEETDKVHEYDTMSQASGGSDLIGIEDKPDFASYEYGRPSINPVMQQNLHKRSKRDDDYDDDDDIRSLPDSINNNSTMF